MANDFKVECTCRSRCGDLILKKYLLAFRYIALKNKEKNSMSLGHETTTGNVETSQNKGKALALKKRVFPRDYEVLLSMTSARRL